MGPTPSPQPGAPAKPPIGPFVAAGQALISALAAFDANLTTALHTRTALRNKYLEGAGGWQGKYHDDFVQQFTSQNSAITQAVETAGKLKGGVEGCLSATLAYYNSQP